MTGVTINECVWRMLFSGCIIISCINSRPTVEQLFVGHVVVIKCLLNTFPFTTPFVILHCGVYHSNTQSRFLGVPLLDVDVVKLWTPTVLVWHTHTHTQLQWQWVREREATSRLQLHHLVCYSNIIHIHLIKHFQWEAGEALINGLDSSETSQNIKFIKKKKSFHRG